MATDERLTTRALNRALLARQGLLERREGSPVEAVEAIGAIQAQHWPAVPAALWSRVRSVDLDGLYAAFDRRELLVGTLLRATQHVVSAREHPAYAWAVEESGVASWVRTGAEPPPEMAALRTDLLAHAATQPRSPEELAAFIEAWLAERRPVLDEAELAWQRSYSWRPYLRMPFLVRHPADGRWSGARLPSESLAAPLSPSPPEGALDDVVRRHLRAFGPASADDVAGWIGCKVPPVRTVLDRLAPQLARFRDEAGRVVYDLSEAPRPDPETPAPVRLLPWFDSTLLAYAPRNRARILPDAYRNVVYVRSNLQWLPTILIDGLVAGTWSMQSGRRHATLALRPFTKLDGPTRGALLEEAEGLVRFLNPASASHEVQVEGG